MRFAMATTRVRTAIKTEFRSGPLRGVGTIKNVSPEGLFVSTGSIPEQGEAVQLVFPVPGGRLALSGMVWWTTAGNHTMGPARRGFGLRLLEAPERFQRLVESLG